MERQPMRSALIEILEAVAASNLSVREAADRIEILPVSFERFATLAKRMVLELNVYSTEEMEAAFRRPRDDREPIERPLAMLSIDEEIYEHPGYDDPNVDELDDELDDIEDGWIYRPENPHANVQGRIRIASDHPFDSDEDNHAFAASDDADEAPPGICFEVRTEKRLRMNGFFGPKNIDVMVETALKVFPTPPEIFDENDELGSI